MDTRYRDHPYTGPPGPATASVDRWVPPWSALGGSWHPASGSPDWVRLMLHQERHRRILPPYPDDATTVSHRNNPFLTYPKPAKPARPLTNGNSHWLWDEGRCVTSGTLDSRIGRFSPGQRKPNLLTRRRFRPTDRHTSILGPIPS